MNITKIQQKFRRLCATKNITREHWLRCRKKGIGGSDAAAVCAVSRWKSPIEVWQEKTCEEICEQEPSEKMRWGILLEPLIADEFARQTGKKIRNLNAILQSVAHPFMLANIDRAITGERAGLECKSTSLWGSKKWDEEGVPQEVYLQCQHYLEVTGWDRWYVALLSNGSEFRWIEILPDLDVIASLIKIESDFWGLVLENVPPPADGSNACSRFLAERFGESNGEEILLPPEAEDLIEQAESWEQAEKEIKTKKREAQNKLKVLLGENEIGVIGENKVEWKPVTRKGYTVAETTYRQFKIKEVA